MGRKQAAETRALTVRQRDIEIARFRVRVTGGVDRGREQISDGAELSIGTAEGNSLVLGDPMVSRHHCTIVATPDGFRLRDLDSTNGTAIGDIRVESAFIEPGSVIAIGESQLTFELADGEIREPLSKEERWGRALGASPAMRRLFAILPRIAASDATVLLVGETGTGKGLLAESIHRQGPRAAQPFVVVDCGAIPPTLIESELFGHEKGAFTGAHASRAGAFERAQHGTVFLDEIGELPLDMQPRLLRALEERTVQRLGGAEPLQLDVRIVAATSRDLRSEVNRGTFRADLFYRLNVACLRVPPLRERREDILILASHFYAQFADGALPPATLLATLADQPWPGNVRELRGAIERAVLLADASLWRELAGEEPAAAAHSDESALSFRAAKEQAIAAWERGWLQALLTRHDGNLSAAARAAKMDRNHLRELVIKHQLRAGED